MFMTLLCTLHWLWVALSIVNKQLPFERALFLNLFSPSSKLPVELFPTPDLPSNTNLCENKIQEIC